MTDITPIQRVMRWNASKADMDLIDKIATRCVVGWGAAPDKLEIAMDITAAHLNGCALDLQRLLNADDFNFAHDVFGIHNHINHETGALEDCFLPRFAQRQ